MFVITVVLLFPLKIRFSRRKSISQILRQRYQLGTLKCFRKLESNQLKIKKTECHLNFLKTCLHYEVTPKFVMFNVVSSGFNNTQNYKRCQLDILKHEITNQEGKLNQLTSHNTTLSSNLKSSVSYLDYRCLSLRITLNNNRIINGVIAKHNKKLLNLGVDRSTKVDPKKVLINLSKRSLTKRETELLCLGLNFALPFSKPNIVDYYAHFENICTIIGKINDSCDKKYTDLLDTVRNQISALTRTSFNYFSKQKIDSPVVCKKDLSILKDLSKNDSIIVTGADKGRGTVILDKTDYNKKLEEILSDQKKFKLLDIEPYKIMLQLEEKLNRLLRKIKDDLGQTTYNTIRATGSIPGRMYGLIKIHKIGNPARPIISSINTFNYNLSKYLIQFLTPITCNAYTISNSYKFLEEIRQQNFNGSYVFTSFDVVSLFTNIPILETIEIAVNKLYALTTTPSLD